MNTLLTPTIILRQSLVTFDAIQRALLEPWSPELEFVIYSRALEKSLDTFEHDILLERIFPWVALMPKDTRFATPPYPEGTERYCGVPMRIEMEENYPTATIKIKLQLLLA